MDQDQATAAAVAAVAEERILSAEDVDNGYKDVEVQSLSGDTQVVRLIAPSWRKRRWVIAEFLKSQDTSLFLLAALPKEADAERLLGRLTPQAVGRLETVSLALTLGEETQKKISAAAGDYLETLRKNIVPTSAANPTWPAPVTPELN